MRGDDLVNRGIIVSRPARPSAAGGKTFIVTGLQRSGTSLIAAILQQAGIFMGQRINDAVFEDEDMLAALQAADPGALRRLIADRNANYGTWGFKVPEIHTRMRPGQLALFGNPHLIVPFRDVAAVSVRKSLSEYKDGMNALRETVDQLGAMVTFLAGISVPSLLVSYEKAVMFGEDFVIELMRFAGLPGNAALHRRLVGLIEPNRRHYIDHARQTFRGNVDGFIHGFLQGWCQLIGDPDPVQLEIHIDGRVATTVAADQFRQDLADAGIGEGRHGFNLDLRPFAPRPDAVIRVKVARWLVELDNSGQPLAQYLRRPT